MAVIPYVHLTAGLVEGNRGVRMTRMSRAAAGECRGDGDEGLIFC